MNDLKISDNLTLPIAAVTQKLAFLGRTGSGKSYAATKLCELMLQAKAQVIALDPVGVWYGLRSGKHGFSVPVFGGLHGDVPLASHSGAMIADLIADRNLSAVLDLSQMVESEQAQFAYDFATHFFQRKKAKASAVHLFIEECQEFIPQNISGRNSEFTARMLNAFERLIKLGRNFGIGASLLSQRPQEVNKKALNQTECLFAFQMTGPQERKAIELWVSEKGAETSVVDMLPKLKVGEPLVWSPQWLGISKTVKIARKITDDVSSTPQHGSSPAKTLKLSDVDIDALRASMTEAIEEARENDPKELRREILRLNADLGIAGQQVAKLQQENKQLREKAEISVVTDADREMVERVISQLDKFYLPKLETLRGRLEAHYTAAGEGMMELKQFASRAGSNLHKMHNSSHPQAPAAARPAPKSRTASAPVYGSMVWGGLRRMMIALAQRPGLNAKQLGVRAGLSSSSGTFGTYLAKARSSGWIEGDRNSMQLTADGTAALGSYEPLPSGRALLLYWKNELGGGAARMLEVLANEFPKFIPKQDLGFAAGIVHTSGTFGTYLAKLRTLELVEGKSELRASPELFD
jgi:hypothetical protein